MKTLVDTCCLLNLIRSGSFETIFNASFRELMLQGIVYDEMTSEQSFIDYQATKNNIVIVDGSTIFASQVGEIIDRYNIGAGEAECIALGKMFRCHVASDDRKARQAAQAELGADQIIGSLGILRESVETGVLLPERAHECCDAMRAAGGFLPTVPAGFFQSPGAPF